MDTAERCFVDVRRRTRPMMCVMNVQSVGRIIFSIFTFAPAFLDIAYPIT